MSTEYTCRCLNVRLTPQTLPSPSSKPRVPASEGFQWVYVGQEGLRITHSHLTFRSREDRQSRFAENATTRTSLTCLVCQTMVYGVSTSNGEHLPSGPVARNEELFYDQPLKSIDGWVEVCTNTLITEADIESTSKSSRWSSHFSVVLPSSPSESQDSELQSRLSSIPIAFPVLPPLFEPPPFTPKHSIFFYLSERATTVSTELRRKAQQDIEEMVKRRLAEVESMETMLKKEVDTLWNTWRDAWKKQSLLHRPTEAKDEDSVRETSPAPVVPAFSVRSFSPSSRVQDAARSSAHSTPPTTSLLSTSLAKSSFHYRPPQSVESDTDSITPSSPPAEPILPPSKSISIGPYNRGLDDSVAVAASLKITFQDQFGRNATKKQQEPALPAALKQVPEEPQTVNEAPKDLTSKVASHEGNGSKKVTFDTTVAVAERTEQAEDAADDEVTEEVAMFDLEPDPPEENSGNTTQPINSEPPPPPTKITVVMDTKPDPPPVEAQLRKLVAGDAPSHRSAWKDGKGWDIYSRRYSRASSKWSGDSENMDGMNDRPIEVSQFAISLPITIAPIQWQEQGNLEPKTSLVDKPGVLVPPLRPGGRPVTGPSRRVISSARDMGMSRSIDPGPAMAIPDEDEEEEEADNMAELGENERSRRTALKILQTQSYVPDEGMWRSMAN